MKKKIIIQIIVITILAIILGILVKFTVDSINENSMLRMSNKGMNEQNEKNARTNG